MDGGAGYERARDRMAGDEESEPAVERSGEYVEDCCCPYTDPEGGLPLADCPCFHPVELLLVAHPAPPTGGLACS